MKNLIVYREKEDNKKQCFELINVHALFVCVFGNM